MIFKLNPITFISSFRKDIIAAIESATKQGVIVVSCTQVGYRCTGVLVVSCTQVGYSRAGVLVVSCT